MCIEESAITIKVIFKLYYKIILPLNNKFSSLIQGVEEIILNNNNNKKKQSIKKHAHLFKIRVNLTFHFSTKSVIIWKNKNLC